MTPMQELRFVATPEAGEVSALLRRPPEAKWLYVFGHGAGAGMRHAFLESVCELLAGRGIATFRYQFPFRERGRRAPDRPPVLRATVRAAVAAARSAAADLPLLAGGKSMGGRMTSLAAAEKPLSGVEGLVFFGFPLHPAGRPSQARGAHLAAVSVPLLFLQGTRDKLAGLDLLRPLLEPLRPRATLHVEEGADHSFRTLKRSGRTHEEVLEELARTVDDWARGLPLA